MKSIGVEWSLDQSQDWHLVTTLYYSLVTSCRQESHKTIWCCNWPPSLPSSTSRVWKGST